MGAVNYSTSDYITLGIRPYSRFDLENNTDFMTEIRAEVAEYGGTEEEAIEDYISDCYEADIENVETILSHYSFYYYHVVIKPGYYEGFTIDIENNFPVAYDNYEDKRDAQKEITQLKKCLLELAGIGLVACSPGWVTGYKDYKDTCKFIESAVVIMRNEARETDLRIILATRAFARVFSCKRGVGTSEEDSRLYTATSKRDLLD